MPEETVTQEPEGTNAPDGEGASSDGPDYQKMYEESQESSQAKLDEVTRSFEKSQAASDAKMRQLESLLVEVANAPQAPGQPAQPAEDVDLSDPNAAMKLIDKMVDAKLQRHTQQVNQAFGSIAANDFEKERTQYKSENPAVYKVLEDDIDAYFQKYPEETKRLGAFNEVVTYLKGQNFDKVAEAVKPRSSGGAPPSPTPTAPTGPQVTESKQAPELSPEQARLAAIYGALEGRDALSAEEWHNVADNPEKYPGRRPDGSGFSRR